MSFEGAEMNCYQRWCVVCKRRRVQETKDITKLLRNGGKVIYECTECKTRYLLNHKELIKYDGTVYVSKSVYFSARRRQNLLLEAQEAYLGY